MLILNFAFAFLGAATVFFLALGLARITGKDKKSEQFSAMIASITQSEIDAEIKEKGIPKENSWSGYWLRLALDAGWRPPNNETPGRAVIIATLLMFLAGTLIIDVVIGLGVALAVVFVARTFLIFRATLRRKLMESQLPNMINGMRANLQASLTPQQAILSQVDDIPAPLGDELKILRNEVDVNIPLETALTNFAYRIPSREVKFLISSVKIAIASGVDLDPQLKIIQDIIVQRQKIANHLSAAVAAVQPSIIASAIAIPAGFAWSFYSNPTNQEFWGSLMGWVGIGVIAVLYVAGLFFSRKLVKKVEES